MYLFHFLVFSTVFTITVNGQLKDCPSSSGSTTLANLKSILLCDYDSLIRPVKDHRNATSIAFRILLKYFYYDHFTHTLTVDSWFPVYWIDQHLKWKPEEYDGIKSVHLLSSYDLWVPDLSVYNRKDQSTDPKIIKDVSCVVSNKGAVLCVPPVRFEALCVANLKYYPYDTQKCLVRFGSWIHKGEEIDIKIIKPVIFTDDLEPNGEWDLISTNAVRLDGNYSCCPNNTYPSIEVTFELKRHAGAHAINVLFPFIVCVLLTFASILMSPLNRDRLILGCVSLFAHVYHVQTFLLSVPSVGDNMPNLLLMSRDSLLLTGFSIVATIFLKYLMTNDKPTPMWMSGAVSVLIRSKPGQMILLPDNSFKGVASSENKEDGITIIGESQSGSQGDQAILGRFLDIIFFYIYFLIYFVCFIRF